jgi:hypothetical protein
MQRRNFIKAVLASTAVSGAPSIANPAPANERQTWSTLLVKIARPVLSAMANGTLQKTMTVELSPIWDGRDRRVTYMECFGRLMAGLSPWLTLPDDTTAEGVKRRTLRQLALESFAHSVDPQNPDYLLWRSEGQPLVDSAYFSNALLRAPNQLWSPLGNTTKARIISELKLLRRVTPPINNWLLFAAMNETFLLAAGEQYDAERIRRAIQKINDWYAGDGWYSDGPRFHFDYYNSYVIHPMLFEILEVLERTGTGLGFASIKDLKTQALKRMQRYGEHLERIISPEGTFSPHGRSSTYRTAVFQPLALMAWKKLLPASLSEGRIRAAISAVHKRLFANPTNFTPDGFLTLGFAGHHPEIADRYSNNGSMYITTESFLALGLAASDSFWTAPAEDWTTRRAYGGEPFARDYAVDY